MMSKLPYRARRQRIRAAPRLDPGAAPRRFDEPDRDLAVERVEERRAGELADGGEGSGSPELGPGVAAAIRAPVPSAIP